MENETRSIKCPDCGGTGSKRDDGEILSPDDICPTCDTSGFVYPMQIRRRIKAGITISPLAVIALDALAADVVKEPTK